MFFSIRVVIPLCGGNIDTTVLGRCLERGLAADGRLVKFTVTVSDRPGGECHPSFVYVYCFILFFEKFLVKMILWTLNLKVYLFLN